MKSTKQKGEQQIPNKSSQKQHANNNEVRTRVASQECHTYPGLCSPSLSVVSNTIRFLIAAPDAADAKRLLVLAVERHTVLVREDNISTGIFLAN